MPLGNNIRTPCGNTKTCLSWNEKRHLWAGETRVDDRLRKPGSTPRFDLCNDLVAKAGGVDGVDTRAQPDAERGRCEQPGPSIDRSDVPDLSRGSTFERVRERAT